MAGKPNQPLLIAVVGETASGKSSLALEIAKRYHGEIICADSRTIYKGMDIGTAKPTLKERAEVPHHLLDVVAPGESFTAADFKRLAEKAIEEIAARNKLPIMVGGTGLYVDSILFDYKFAPKANEARRAALHARSLEELQQEVQQADLDLPENEKNRRYLIRTLERLGSYSDDRQSLRPHTLVLGLTISRARLRKRIEERVEQMFRKGLRREVEELRASYGWESEALTGIGYREFRAYYDEQMSMSEVKREIVQHTIHLAKRQRTWFKRNPAIKWVESQDDAIQEVDAFLSR